MSESLTDQIAELVDRAESAEALAASLGREVERVQRALDSAQREVVAHRAGLKLEEKVRNQADANNALQLGMERMRAERDAAVAKAAGLAAFNRALPDLEGALGVHYDLRAWPVDRRVAVAVRLAAELRGFYDLEQERAYRAATAAAAAKSVEKLINEVRAK
ncbi:hypothetical protein ACXR2W_00960 [Leucobacter sp. HY1908]